MIQVSVVVATYRSDPQRVKATLDSIVRQKNIGFEIVLTDDGSPQRDFSWLPAYFEQCGVEQYQLLPHPENMGTVRNILAGVSAARGEYIYCLSPGDLLYDDAVLHDLYAFAKSRNCKISFGNSVPYSVKDGAPYLTREYTTPRCPDLYNCGQKTGKLTFFDADWIIGISYFRERTYAIDILTKAAQTSKYVEDTTTTAIALMDGERVYYLDRNVAWYEDGVGISTNGSSVWAERTSQDIRRTFQMLREQYPQEILLDFALLNVSGLTGWQGKLTRLCRFPGLVLKRKILKYKYQPKKLRVQNAELAALQSLLAGDL